MINKTPSEILADLESYDHNVVYQQWLSEFNDHNRRPVRVHTGTMADLRKLRSQAS